jgi:hypothetical protein
VLLRSCSCAEIYPKPVSRELTPAGTSAHRRLFAQVDFRRQMRPIAFVDPGAFSVTYRVRFPKSGLLGTFASRRAAHHPCNAVPAFRYLMRWFAAIGSEKAIRTAPLPSLGHFGACASCSHDLSYDQSKIHTKLCS